MAHDTPRAAAGTSDGASVIFYIGKTPGTFRWELRRIVVTVE